jgi:hypothetical protein
MSSITSLVERERDLLLYGFIKIKFKEIVMNALFTTRNMFVAMILLASNSANADMITAWTFDNLPVAINNTPAPSTGVGNASSLGMTNNYTYAGTTTTGSVTTDDIVVGSSNSNEWRIRGTGGNANDNGWNLSAPQYSQGAQFTASTANYSNIDLSFSWFSTNQGIRDMQVQYTANGSTWINIGSLLIAAPNAYASENVNFGTLGITSINNDTNFGVRLVSAYDPTLNTYASATLVSGNPVAYNNSSGNWRFDNVVITGVAAPVPEADSYAMLLGGLGVLGLMVRRRKSALWSRGADAPAIDLSSFKLKSLEKFKCKFVEN